MKKLITMTLALLMLFCPLLAQADRSADDSATLTVTGAASVSLKADYAQVSVGVSTRARTIEEASGQNAEAIHAVIAALKAAGVLEEDIATSNYSVYAEYDYSTGEAVQTGYNVSNQLNVSIRDMEHVGAILDKATRAGANNIYNVTFCSTASAQAQDEAMTHAVQDAFRKAELLAAAAGLEVGSVMTIRESTTGVFTTGVTYKAEAARDAVSNVILPDDLTVSASVELTVRLVERRLAVTGEYEPFSMVADKSYYDDKTGHFPCETVFGPTFSAEEALTDAKALWTEVFPECDCSSRPCIVRYDSGAGVWHVKGTLPQSAVFGGCANILIRAEDGQVLALWHER